jgi:hypothetical protein
MYNAKVVLVWVLMVDRIKVLQHCTSNREPDLVLEVVFRLLRCPTYVAVIIIRSL